jgi:hypothetical protein
VTEQVHRAEVVRGPVEVQEWVDLVGGEWVVPEQVQDQEEIACVQNAERLSLMKQERRATL